ncbi:MAG: hypothetical protein KAR47_11135, partial [Planctomycetes bacterium]|nr:hypothetical protein [Planctomycetota bacterium]
NAFTVGLTILATLLFSPVAHSGTYGGGTGEPNDPYQIWNANDMNAIGTNSDDWDKHFILMADIDLAGYDGLDGRPDFTPIGHRDPYGSTPFIGVFDGNMHTINNFTFVKYAAYKGGIFASLDFPGEIKDLTMTNPMINVPNKGQMGTLACRADGGTIRNCHVLGGSINGDGYIGPLVGDNWADIHQCSASTPVIGYDHVGGLVGRNHGRIYNSFATGSVTGTILVGGFTGRCSDAFDSSGIIQNCYATGDVSGDYAGGLVGQLWGGVIATSYSAGQVSGTEAIGGLVGEIVSGGFVMQSFWDTQSSTLLVSAGGTGKTTAEMKSEITFVTSGWNFGSVWSIIENQTYPFFQWTTPVCGDANHPYPVGDLDTNCVVNLADFAMMCGHWLEDNRP